MAPEFCDLLPDQWIERDREGGLTLVTERHDVRSYVPITFANLAEYCKWVIRNAEKLEELLGWDTKRAISTMEVVLKGVDDDGEWPT